MVAKRGIEVRLTGRQAEHLRAAREGRLDVSDWDIDELIRGYRRAKDGTFKGAKPKVVPREVHEELAKLVKTKVAHELLAITYDKIVPVIEKVLNGDFYAEDAPAMRLQLQAAQDLMDRFVVTKEEKISISGTMTHEHIIDRVTIARDLDEFDEGEIEDAEIVEEDDEEFIFDE